MQHMTCQRCRSAFDIDVHDQQFYASMQVPLPTFCPTCRFQRRSSHINTRTLYQRRLHDGGPAVVSTYAPEKSYVIIEDSRWWSDSFDPFATGSSYDFDIPFFHQFDALYRRTPLPHLQRNWSTFENSEYCNAASGLKNCYLISNADNNDACMYAFCIEECKDCLDCAMVNRSELCYECVNVKGSYECLWCDDCEQCQKVLFSRDCIGCSHCFGCLGLRHASYCIFNEQKTEREYADIVAGFALDRWEGLQHARATCAAFIHAQPQRYMHGRHNEAVSGDYIYQSRNVRDAYFVEKTEDTRYAHFLRYLTTGTSHAYDFTMFGNAAEHIYESAWCGLNVNNLKFCLWNYGSADLEYCIGCHSSRHCFGCIGVRHREYCILNVQYTADEYMALLPRIRAHMMQVPYRDAQGCEYRYGEFFPSALSPFAYNETWAQQFCPLSRASALQEGFAWYDAPPRPERDAVHWRDLPDDASMWTPSMVQRPILCKAYDEHPGAAHEHHCSTYFKLTPQELLFYQKMHLPLPRYCQNSRHFHRMRSINPFVLHERSCAACHTTLTTTYTTDRCASVLCQSCYERSRYG